MTFVLSVKIHLSSLFLLPADPIYGDSQIQTGFGKWSVRIHPFIACITFAASDIFITLLSCKALLNWRGVIQISKHRSGNSTASPQTAALPLVPRVSKCIMYTKLPQLQEAVLDGFSYLLLIFMLLFQLLIAQMWKWSFHLQFLSWSWIFSKLSKSLF